MTYNALSPEVTSTMAPDEEANERIRALTDKLSAALLNVTAKEELSIQHTSVAEEAVAGWERADREALGLKLQLDAALKKNEALEDRVSHLDGALKECVRQLGQGKEEKERKIEEAMAKRKSELDSQMSELRNQLEEAKSEAAGYSPITMDGLRPRVEAAELENSSLKRELNSLSKALEITALERDLSTKSAETASKQHLESIKKVAKLEAECRRLKFCMSKASLPSEHRRSFTVNVDSLIDNPSDNGERLEALEADVHECDHMREYDRFKGEKSLKRSHVTSSSSGIVLMDDFLEMERLASLPYTGNREVPLDLLGSSDMVGGEEVEAMIKRNADLEERIRKLEAEKLEFEMAMSVSQSHFSTPEGERKDVNVRSAELEAQLSECQAQLRTSQGQLKASKTELISLQHQLSECRDQLRTSQAKLKGAETELVELQTQLIEHEDQLSASEAYLKGVNAKLEEAENQLFEREDNLNASQSQLKDAELSLMELQMKLTEREDQLTASQGQLEYTKDEMVKLQTQLFEREYQATASQEQLEVVEAELRKLKGQLLACEGELKRSQGQVEDIESQLLEMQTQLTECEDKLEKSQGQTKDGDTKLAEIHAELGLVAKLKEAVEGELVESNARREEAELQVKSLLAKVESLVDEGNKERALSAEMTATCSKLEDELSERKLQPQLQLEWNCSADIKAEQEKELAVAASRLADCQKTIASLGRQLQSLATIDDFLADADTSLEFSGGSPIFFRTGQLGIPPSVDCQ